MSPLLLLLLLPSLAQQQNSTAVSPPPPPPPPPPSFNPRFNPSMAVLVVVLMTTFFFVTFFSIYVRQCGSDAPPGGAAPATSRCVGLQPSAIESLPTLLYSDIKGHRVGIHSSTPLECAVCLSDFTDSDILRLLPHCSHAFHPRCIDPWLSSRPTCPVCRHDLSLDPPPPQVDPWDGRRRWTEEERVRRFTLRLPEEVRREVLSGRLLHRSVSMVVLPGGEWSTREGGSSRGGRRLLWPVKSDRWALLGRKLTWPRREDGGDSSTKRGEGSSSRGGASATTAADSLV